VPEPGIGIGKCLVKLETRGGNLACARMSHVLISVVIPVFLGEHTLPTLVAELAGVKAEWESGQLPITLVEAIFVDDGSRDGSARVLASLKRQYPWIRMITLPRNLGQHPATMAGISQTCGDWIVTLDEDLQHHPRHIGEMLALAARDSLDVVYARPAGSVHESIFRDGAARLCKALIAALTANPHVRDFNSFRLIRGDIARAAAAAAKEDTYLDVGLCRFSDRFGTHTVEMKDRRFIEKKSSGWTTRALLSHARRMLVSSLQSKPVLFQVDHSKDALLRPLIEQ
jgi:polyisoprenyl-phosphate glycosyltransferase